MDGSPSENRRENMDATERAAQGQTRGQTRGQPRSQTQGQGQVQDETQGDTHAFNGVVGRDALIHRLEMRVRGTRALGRPSPHALFTGPERLTEVEPRAS